MKKIVIYSLVVLVATMYLSCAKKKTNIEFDVVYTTDLAIPSMTAGMVYTLTSQDVLTRVNDELTKNGTNSDLVGEAFYTQFDLAVKTPTTGNLGWIKWVKFYINAINQPELQVSWRYNERNDTILPTAKTATLKLNEPNLKNRFMENSVYFKYKIEPVSATTAMTLTATHKIHVKAITE